MNDAIQKAREALEAAREVLSDAENFWGLDFDSALRKTDTALAALDAETPATPADVGEEPVAWQWRYRYDDGKWGDWQSERRPDADDLLASNVLIAEEKRPLYSATALERVVRDRDEAREHIRKQADDIMTLGQLVYADTDTTWKARAESAEAKLAEARKVIEAVNTAAAKEPYAGQKDDRHLHNAWRGWWKKVFGPALEDARRFLEETK